MPSKSKKQRVAMQIAAAGKSNIGIPQSVGKKFVQADKRVKASKGGSCFIAKGCGKVMENRRKVTKTTHYV